MQLKVFKTVESPFALSSFSPVSTSVKTDMAVNALEIVISSTDSFYIFKLHFSDYFIFTF